MTLTPRNARTDPTREALEKARDFADFVLGYAHPEMPMLVNEAQRTRKHIDAALADHPPAQEAVAYGIIDPDYARVFTVARCIAWSEGYALMMHGSFTRDLDLLAVPWADRATEPDHLVRRIEAALDDLQILPKARGDENQASAKPHGRLAWTLTFKAFGDPRFIDLSVMPRLSPAPVSAQADGVEKGRTQFYAEVSAALNSGGGK